MDSDKLSLDIMSVYTGNERNKSREKGEKKSLFTYMKTCNPTVYDLVPASTGTRGSMSWQGPIYTEDSSSRSRWVRSRPDVNSVVYTMT